MIHTSKEIEEQSPWPINWTLSVNCSVGVGMTDRCQAGTPGRPRMEMQTDAVLTMLYHPGGNKAWEETCPLYFLMPFSLTGLKQAPLC